jgi:hypothetical protein
MTLQDVIRSLDDLSVQDQASLFQVLSRRLSEVAAKESAPAPQGNGDTFWAGVLKFRERIEQEGIEFTDEDFADLRDRSPGREIEL